MSIPLLSLIPSVCLFCLVKFEACHLNERISFESSDPKFGVHPDGSLYAEQDLMNLSEPIRFVVTAQGSKDPQIWKTLVKLVITQHPRPPFINQVRLQLSPGKKKASFVLVINQSRA